MNGTSKGTLVVLWLVVAFEVLSPLPAVLSFVAIWVLVARPPWFYRLVTDLYAGH